MNKQDYLRTMEQQLMARSIDRRHFMRGVLATGLTVAAASAWADRVQAATPKKGGSLTAGLGHGATSETLDPGLLAAGFLIPLGLAMNGYLTEIDPSNEVQPSLAESWEVSPDASVWRFKLRKGAEFHNGKTVTPEDVVASINHHRGEKTTSAAAPLMAGVRDIRVDGGDVVVFELEAGNADFPAALSDYHIAIMPAAAGSMDWQSGIGSGAYRLDEFDPGVAATLSKHANHWTDEAGHVDEWRLLVLLDTNARMTAALTGDVDVADKIDVKTAGRLAGNPNLNVHSVAGTQHYSFP
ncbi:MAG: ABC transporter substrate-binding protein, partial [Pseudomonadota bacterium]